MSNIATFKDRSIYWLSLLSFLLVMLDYFTVLEQPKSVLEKNFILPVKKSVHQQGQALLSFPQVFLQYPRLNRLIKDLASLELEKEELKFENQLLKKENEELKTQLGSPLPASYQFIPALVIGSIPDGLEIEAGEADGVKVGMPVVKGKVFIGRIESVAKYRARITLPSHSSMRLAVKTSRKAKGLVMGRSAGNIALEEVLQKEPLFIGDQVITAGQEGSPPNLLIGRIVYITTSDEEVYKQAKIEPVVDYGQVHTVFVIVSY